MLTNNKLILAETMLAFELLAFELFEFELLTELSVTFICNEEQINLTVRFAFVEFELFVTFAPVALLKFPLVKS